MADQTSNALVPLAAADIVHGEATPLPVFSGDLMVQGVNAYRELQKALDASMPDQIMSIGDRQFRKKGYWRAVAVAFNLSVEPVEERREVAGLFDDGRENFGYLVTYRAVARGGRASTGDGSCFAVEKAAKFRCPHPQEGNPNRSQHFPHERCPDYDPMFRWQALPDQATEHNVRSHAHTRAMNRAVSNLCGFGEVSAEEMERDDDDTTGSRPTSRPSSTSGPNIITEPQRKRMFAIARNHGINDVELHTLLSRHGFESANDVTRAKYDTICNELERGQRS